MAGGPPDDRRPIEMTLQEMERRVPRLLRSAEMEERRNAARARRVEHLKAEIELLRKQHDELDRDLSTARGDWGALERRLEGLAEALGRISTGEGLDPTGSLSAQIVQLKESTATQDAALAEAAEAKAAAARRPVAVAGSRLPAVLVHGRFEPPKASPGTEVVYSVQAHGFEDGTEVTLELWDRAREQRLGELHGTVDSEHVQVQLKVPAAAAGFGGMLIHAVVGQRDSWSEPLECINRAASTSPV